ncbi:MAG: GNAT family N-acetyltransferase [Acidobacteria bacterium]|nr:GNAT family N-acetyltransferase [Acidobacteriota bacterium]
MDFTRNRGDLVISSDRARLDVAFIHEFLTHCYWAEGIPRPVVERSIANSICFGLYDGASQIGFARVISDCATYAYVADVFVSESHRGRGLGKWLVECVLQHPDLQGLRRWALVTRDAHRLYENFGFAPLAAPERHMEIHRPAIYPGVRAMIVQP